MGTWRTTDLGTSRATCASCRQEADLRLTESSYRRSWRDAFGGGRDRRVDRRVHCSACGAVYPVRPTDPVPGDLDVRRPSPSPRSGRGRRASDASS